MSEIYCPINEWALFVDLSQRLSLGNAFLVRMMMTHLEDHDDEPAMSAANENGLMIYSLSSSPVWSMPADIITPGISQSSDIPLFVAADQTKLAENYHKALTKTLQDLKEL